MPRFATPIALLAVLLVATTVSAQQQGGGTDTGTGGQTNTGTGTGTGAGLGTLNADEAFSAIERGGAVGSTGDTGSGFSELSAANGGAGGLGGRGGFGGGGIGGLGGLGGLFGGLNGNAGQSTQPAIRTRLRSAIRVQPRTSVAIGQSASRRFRQLATRPGLRGLNVVMNGRTAVITGVVRSDRDRRMSSLLVQLEPGVRQVDNQVVVAAE